MGLKHSFTSGKIDSSDATLIQPSNWNAEHLISPLAVSNLAFSGATIYPARNLNDATLNTFPHIFAGSVLMIHDFSGNGTPAVSGGPGFTGGNNQWVVYKPDGSVLDISASTTQGLQEAINYAIWNGYPLFVFGGGITNPGHNSNIPWAFSNIVCTTPISIPTIWQNTFHMHGVTCWYLTNDTTDFFTFDSSEMAHVDWNESQIVSASSGAIVRFNAQHNMGDSFIGTTTGRFRFGHLINYNAAGTGLRFSMPFVSGQPYGAGLVVESNFEAQEIGGGLICVLVDDPGVSGGTNNQFIGNYLRFMRIISDKPNGYGIKVGTSSVSVDKIHGNRWEAEINCTGSNTTAFAHAGGGSGNGGDLFTGNILTATTGIIITSPGSMGHNFITGSNQTSNRYVDQSTLKRNRYSGSGHMNRTDLALGSSPFVYQNSAGCDVHLSIAASGATLTALGISPDGISYDYLSSISTNLSVGPGEFFTLSWSAGTPHVLEYFSN